MNLQEIINEVNKNVDDTLENADVIGWVNRCIDDLIPIANNQTILTMPILANQQSYTLPSDFVEMVQVVRNGNFTRPLALSDTASYGYKLFNNKIMLQPIPDAAGSMDLYYKSILPYLSTMDDVPQIPAFFHDLFIHFVVAKYEFQDQNLELQQIAVNTYESRRRDFINYMNKTNIPAQIIDVYGMCWND